MLGVVGGGTAGADEGGGDVGVEAFVEGVGLLEAVERGCRWRVLVRAW